MDCDSAGNGVSGKSGIADGASNNDQTSDKVNPFMPNKAIQRSPKKEDNDAFKRLMTNRGVGLIRQRTISLPGDVEAETGKRKMDPSEKKDQAVKKQKQTTETLQRQLEDQMRNCKMQMDEHSIMKREIKTSFEEMVKMYELFKKAIAAERAQFIELTKSKSNVRSGLSTDMKEQDIKKVIGAGWPNEAFTSTKIISEDYDGEDKITSAIVHPTAFNDDPNFKCFSSRTQMLKNVTAEKLKTLESILIEQVTNIPGLTDAENNKPETFILQAAVLSDGKTIEITDIIKWCEQLKVAAVNRKINTIQLHLPEQCNIYEARKIIECCFFGTTYKVLIKLSQNQRKTPRTQPNQPKREEMIVRVGTGFSYSDVVKDLKMNVNPESLGIDVKRIESTGKGDVRISFTEKKEGGKMSLLANINTNVKKATEVTVVQKTKGVVLLDIEDDITEKEVVDVIANTIKITADSLRLNEFRPTYRGTKMITMYLPMEAARELINMKRIPLGWTMCRVKEKIDPDFCVKCKRYGHLIKNCKEKETSLRRCLKCGKSDHLTAECEGAEACYVCSVAGHRANSMKCPAYKAAIKAREAGRRSRTD